MQEFINFATVLVVAVCVAGMISMLYASGLRLWAAGGLDREGCAHYAARGVGDLLHWLRVYRAVRSVAHDSNFPLNNSRNSLFERLK